MKKILIYLVIPSILLVCVMWYFSLFTTEIKSTHKKIVMVPVRVKQKEAKLNVAYLNTYNKKEIPIRNLLVIQDSVIVMSDTTKMIKQSIPIERKYETKKITKKIVDTVYVEKTIIKEIPIENKEIVSTKDSSIQGTITWLVGILNTLILTLVGAKKLLTKWHKVTS